MKLVISASLLLLMILADDSIPSIDPSTYLQVKKILRYQIWLDMSKIRWTCQEMKSLQVSDEQYACTGRICTNNWENPAKQIEAFVVICEPEPCFAVMNCRVFSNATVVQFSQWRVSTA